MASISGRFRQIQAGLPDPTFSSSPRLGIPSEVSTAPTNPFNGNFDILYPHRFCKFCWSHGPDGLPTGSMMYRCSGQHVAQRISDSCGQENLPAHLSGVLHQGCFAQRISLLILIKCQPWCQSIYATQKQTSLAAGCISIWTGQPSAQSQ